MYGLINNFIRRFARRVKEGFSGLKERIDAVFYKCEYLKECDKVTPQCWRGGNSYGGEYKKKAARSMRKVKLGG